MKKILTAAAFILMMALILTGCSMGGADTPDVVNSNYSGTSSRTCYKCDGTRLCKYCYGYGHCPNCENGIEDCYCNTGICDFCDGSGILDGGYYSTFGHVTAECSYCGGSGVHNSCNGRGYRVCARRNCDGGICTACSGTGICNNCR